MACRGTTVPLRPVLEKVINKRYSKQQRSSDTENDVGKQKSRACGCLDIQGVTGGMCEISGECSLGQTIPM
jgi:hypothetical protein